MEIYPPRAKKRYSEEKKISLALKKKFSFLKPKIPQSRRPPDPVFSGFFSLIPGMGHYYNSREVKKPLIFFLIFAVLFPISFLFLGGAVGTILFIALFWFHSWVVFRAYFEALRMNDRTVNIDLAKSIKISVIIAVLLSVFYWAVRVQLNQFIQPSVVSAHTLQPIFARGDRILVFPRKNYKRGDVVSYNSGYSVGYIERIIGLPDENVKIRDSKIYINDAPLDVSFYPLNSDAVSEPLLQNLNLRVPENSYCILFPIRINPRYPNERIDLSRYYIVYETRINGKVLLKYYPEIKTF